MNPKNKKTISVNVRIDFPWPGSVFQKKGKLLFDEMWDRLAIKDQKELMAKYSQDIPLIAEVLK